MSHPLRTPVSVGADDGFCKTELNGAGDNTVGGEPNGRWSQLTDRNAVSPRGVENGGDVVRWMR